MSEKRRRTDFGIYRQVRSSGTPDVPRRKCGSGYAKHVQAAACAILIAAPAFAQQDIDGSFNTNIGAGSTVDSNNTNETVNYNAPGSAPGSQPANPVMSAVAPTMMGGGGNDSCLIPSSTGIQVTLFGVSRGEMKQDPECNRRKDSRLLGTPQAAGGLGLQVSGISLMCQSAEVFRAMALANTPCPISDVVSGNILIGRNAYVRMRQDPDVYIVGYRQDRAFWDSLLMIGQELPDAPPEPERATLSDRFRRTSGADDSAIRSHRSRDPEPTRIE